MMRHVAKGPSPAGGEPAAVHCGAAVHGRGEGVAEGWRAAGGAR